MLLYSDCSLTTDWLRHKNWYNPRSSDNGLSRYPNDPKPILLLHKLHTALKDQQLLWFWVVVFEDLYKLHFQFVSTEEPKRKPGVNRILITLHCEIYFYNFSKDDKITTIWNYNFISNYCCKYLFNDVTFTDCSNLYMTKSKSFCVSKIQWWE